LSETEDHTQDENPCQHERVAHAPLAFEFLTLSLHISTPGILNLSIAKPLPED
jgi:hypothetical protein